MNINQCAEMVSLSVSTIKGYVKRGMPVKKDGTFDIADVALWISENGTAQHLTKKTDAQIRSEAVKATKAKEKEKAKTKAKVVSIKKTPRQQDDLPPETDLPMTYNEAKTRSEIAKALSAELSLAKELEQVANIDDLMGEFSQALVTVRASLSSMSSRLAGILAHQDEHEVRKLIDAEVTVMLTGLSKYDG